MRLARLEGRGARSLDAPFVLDLPPAGLVRLAGRSGAGKSTLLWLPAFALGHGPAATKLQSWHGTPLGASVTLRGDAGELVVARAGKLALQADGKKVKGNAEALEERLRRELPLEIIKVLAHRKQKQGSAFLAMADERKKTFLVGQTELTGLEQRLKDGKARLATALAARDLAEARRATAASALEAAGGPVDVAAERIRLDALLAEQERRQGALEDAQDDLLTARQAGGGALAALDKVQRRAQAGRVAAAAAAAQRRDTILDELRTHPAQVAVGEAVDRHALVSEAARSARAQDAGRHAEWAQKERTARQLATRGEAVRLPLREAVLKEADTRYAALKGVSPACSVCARPWPEAGERARDAAAASVSAAVRAHAEGEETIAAGVEAQRWLDEHPWAPAPQLARFDEVLAALSERVRVAREALAATRGRLTASVEAAVQTTAQAVHDGLPGPPMVVEALPAVQEALQACARADQAVEAIRAEAAAVARTVTALATRAAARGAAVILAETTALEAGAATERYAEEADTYNAVRAFVARYFDELLQEVADEVNARLGDVPNVQGTSIAFRSEVLRADGEVSRQAIVPVLTVQGHEIGLGELDGASGGMISAVWLAVDLGVLRVLERRRGQRVGWLMLDEPFEGLDEESRKACLELLRVEAQDRLVMVVDHYGETSGLYDRTITVEATDGRAEVRG